MSGRAVILRRRHTRTRYTGDPDAIPYRGWYDHAPRPYLTDTVVLDELGRRNGMTRTWLRYECGNVGCRYVLLVRADHAHDLARDSLPSRSLTGSRAMRRMVEQALTTGGLPTEGTVKVALYTRGHKPDMDAPPVATFTPGDPPAATVTHVNGIPVGVTRDALLQARDLINRSATP